MKQSIPTQRMSRFDGPYKKDEIVIFAEGQYSDFEIQGVWRVLVEFDPESNYSEYCEWEGTNDYKQNYKSLQDWFVDKGLIERVHFRGFHSSYGKVYEGLQECFYARTGHK